MKPHLSIPSKFSETYEFTEGILHQPDLSEGRLDCLENVVSEAEKDYKYTLYWNEQAKK